MPIDWTNPANAEVLTTVERQHPSMKPVNQRRIASRRVRGLPDIQRTPKRRGPDTSALPDGTEYWWGR